MQTDSANQASSGAFPATGMNAYIKKDSTTKRCPQSLLTAQNLGRKTIPSNKSLLVLAEWQEKVKELTLVPSADDALLCCRRKDCLCSLEDLIKASESSLSKESLWLGDRGSGLMVPRL